MRTIYKRKDPLNYEVKRSIIIYGVHHTHAMPSEDPTCNRKNRLSSSPADIIHQSPAYLDNNQSGDGVGVGKEMSAPGVVVNCRSNAVFVGVLADSDLIPRTSLTSFETKLQNVTDMRDISL